MGYGNIFGAPDDLIAFPTAEEEPRLYIAPEVINRELCRMLSARADAPAPEEEAPMKLAQASVSQSPAREYEWPIR